MIDSRAAEGRYKVTCVRSVTGERGITGEVSEDSVTLREAFTKAAAQSASRDFVPCSSGCVEMHYTVCLQVRGHDVCAEAAVCVPSAAAM